MWSGLAWGIDIVAASDVDVGVSGLKPAASSRIALQCVRRLVNARTIRCVGHAWGAEEESQRLLNKYGEGEQGRGFENNQECITTISWQLHWPSTTTGAKSLFRERR